MSKRVWLSSQPPRMMFSKQGFDAGPDCPEDGKVFDSLWTDGTGIKWILECNVSVTNYKWTFTADFPYALDYVPSAMAYVFVSQTYPIAGTVTRNNWKSVVFEAGTVTGLKCSVVIFE